MEIDWTVITCFIIGLFALSGFFKGWWKEAITTVLLAILVFLLANPDVAQWAISGINSIIATVWGWFNTTNPPPQIDATSTTTWLVILIIFLIISSLISRAMLPNGIRRAGFAYETRPMGSIFGGLLGALNGFLIINLVREYIDGRNLPSGGDIPSEIALSGAQSSGNIASSGVTITATDVHAFTILDSYMPWIIMGLGLLVFIALLKSRVGLHSKNGFRKIDYKAPYGYKRVDYKQG